MHLLIIKTILKLKKFNFLISKSLIKNYFIINLNALNYDYYDLKL